MSFDRRTVLKALGITGTIGLTGTAQTRQRSHEGDDNDRARRETQIGLDVRVRQKRDRSVHWILPGERRLSPRVFGTPDNPQFGSARLANKIDQSDNDNVTDLLSTFPLQVGVPDGARNVEDGAFTTTKIPTPFSDSAAATAGELDVTYMDRGGASHGPPPGDDVRFDVRFEDPAGNVYEADVTGLEVEGPIHETGGGVMTNAVIHGDTGIGTPLEPRQYLYGAFWGVCDLHVNGELFDENRAVHFMTTEVVRDRDYRLAIDEELPLGDQAFAGREHHTHGIFPPVKATADGPVFDPVAPPFELPNGNKQPFIHVMFDEDELHTVRPPHGKGGQEEKQHPDEREDDELEDNR